MHSFVKFVCCCLVCLICTIAKFANIEQYVRREETAQCIKLITGLAQIHVFLSMYIYVIARCEISNLLIEPLSVL